jgi:hypothetical protein
MSNHSQDLLKELNYLMSLLSSTTKLDDDEIYSLKSEESIILENIGKISLFEVNEEGMYFAALVLEQLWNLLKQLNTATLRTLTHVLNAIVPEFADRISQHVEEVRKNH